MFEKRGYHRLSARRGPVSFDETHFSLLNALPEQLSWQHTCQLATPSRYRILIW
jgi:hypothetical protein